MEVLVFLRDLGEKWVEFAKFIGFEEEEVTRLQDLSPDNITKQIWNFSKLWRMPNLASTKNNEVLYEVLQVANITTGIYKCMHVYIIYMYLYQMISIGRSQ